MKLRFISNLLLILVTFLLHASAIAQGLEFDLIPPKSAQPGQSIDFILPIRILDSACSYSIESEGQPNYPVEHARNVSIAQGENSTVYLPFVAKIPAIAVSGSIYQLKVLFVPNSECSDQMTYSHKLVAKIQAYDNISFEGSTKRVNQSSVASNLEVLLRNSGNTDLNLDLSIESLTSNVRIDINPKRLTLGAGTYKNVRVNIDFSGSGADFASFRVIARSNGERFLSKNYQVRLLKGSRQKSDQRELDSQFFATNEFFSEAGASTNYQNIGASIQGDLSDFYRVSIFAQSNYLSTEDESSFYEVDLEKYDDFRITLGSNLSPLSGSVPGVNQLKGLRAQKQFFKDLNVGVFAGNDFEGDSHIGSFLDYNSGYKNRWILFWDKNTNTNFDSFGISGEKYFRVNQALAIAPSLILARDEDRGDYSRVSIALSSLISEKAPLQLEVVREEELRYKRDSVDSRVHLPYKNLNFVIGARIDDVQSKLKISQIVDGTYGDGYFRVLFPVVKKVNGQLTLRYQHTAQGESGYAPELYLSAQDGAWNGWVRFGEQLTQSPQTLASTNQNDNLGSEKYVQFSLQYLPASGIGYYLGAESYQSNENDNYRDDVSIGVQKKFNDRSMLRVGFRANKSQSSFQSQNTVSLDTQYNYEFAKNWNFSIGASIDHLSDLDEYSYQANFGIRYTPSIPVSSRVENTFGGKSTGTISGIMCIDYNDDQVCNDGDKLLKGVELRIDGIVSITNENGEYEFKQLAPKSYNLKVSRNTLPAEASLTQSVREINIKANDKKKINFALEWHASIKVIVFEDINGDGIWQNESEKQLPNVEVGLFDDDQEKFLTSSSTFPTVFTKLKKGKYSLKITKTLRNAVSTQADGVEIVIPHENGNWVYLGLQFTDEEEEDDSIVATLVEPIVYKDYLKAQIYIDDPHKKVQWYEFSCRGYVSSKKSINTTEDSFMLDVDLSNCNLLQEGESLELVLKLSDARKTVITEFNLEVIIK